MWFAIFWVCLMAVSLALLVRSEIKKKEFEQWLSEKRDEAEKENNNE